MSPGVVAHYPANTIGDQTSKDNLAFINALVRLRGGGAALPQFRTDVARITGRSDIDFMDLPAQFRQIQRQLSFEARCLLAFAVAASSHRCSWWGRRSCGTRPEARLSCRPCAPWA